MQTHLAIIYGTGDANVTTSYGYDVGNRLTWVTMPSQTRSFSYDRAGLLQSETHPELGVSGNGTTSYTRYDSRGHVLRKVDGNKDVGDSKPLRIPMSRSWILKKRRRLLGSLAER